MIFHFRLFKSILFFVNSNSLCFFRLLYCTNKLCLLLLYLIRVLTRSTPVSLQDFYWSLPKGSVTGCDSLLWSFFLVNVYFISRSCIFFSDTVITTI